jgi:hypothetical protein
MAEIRGPKATVEKAAAAKVVYEADVNEVLDTLLDLELEYRMDMSKHAGVIFAAAPHTDIWERDISDFEKEALYLQPAHLVKKAGDFLESFAEPYHVKLVRHNHDEGLAKRAFDVTSALGEHFAALAKAVGAREVIVKMAQGKVSQEEYEAAGGAMDDVRTRMPTFTGGGADPEAPTDLETPPDGATDALNEEAGARTGAPAPGGPPAGGSSTTDLAALRELLLQQRGGSGSGGGGKTPPDKKSEKGSGKGTAGGGMGQIAAVLGAPIKATSSVITGAASKADETLTRITSKERDNKAQRRSDLDVADVRRAINLRRMIGTDPVLREADPRDVLEIYNSITELNPELAGNMPALRLILREAVSYEGLTLDSQKLLADIGKNRAQGEQAMAENDKRRYASGGANPINLLPSKA